jgi:hypothetical protein
MPQKVARPTQTDSPYESSAETEAAVKRIHEHFTGIKAEIAKEKAGKTSAATDSPRRQPQSALDLEALQLTLGALTEARDSLKTAHRVVCTSIETVKRAMAAQQLRDR